MHADQLRRRGPRSYDARQRRYQAFLKLKTQSDSVRRSGETNSTLASADVNVSLRSDLSNTFQYIPLGGVGVAATEGTPCLDCSVFPPVSTFVNECGLRDPGPCESGPSSTTVTNIAQASADGAQRFSFLLINTRSLLKHKGELEGHLRSLGYPLFVGITESWLNKSVSDPTLSGYVVVSWLDRSMRSGGGIILFALEAYAATIVHVGDSEQAERSWHTLHTDAGPFVICLWYRPPSYETDSVRSLSAEWFKYADSSIGALVLGDLNVNHQSWLRRSNSTTPAGIALFDFCSTVGLFERTKVPTRGCHLLDLVLTDVPDIVSTTVHAGVSDHLMVLAEVALPVTAQRTEERWVWLYKSADWLGLNHYFSNTPWNEIINDDIEDSAANFTRYVLDGASRFISQRYVSKDKPSHP